MFNLRSLSHLETCHGRTQVRVEEILQVLKTAVEPLKLEIVYPEGVLRKGPIDKPQDCQ